MCLLLGFVTKLSAAVNFSSDELWPLTQAPKSVDLRMVQCLVSHGSRSSSGSMAMLAAMRRASSRVISLVADRHPGSLSK